jgi:hypothetical protein
MWPNPSGCPQLQRIKEGRSRLSRQSCYWLPPLANVSKVQS